MHIAFADASEYFSHTFVTVSLKFYLWVNMRTAAGPKFSSRNLNPEIPTPSRAPFNARKVLKTSLHPDSKKSVSQFTVSMTSSLSQFALPPTYYLQCK